MSKPDALGNWVDDHTQWARRGRFQTLKFLAIYALVAVISVGAIWLFLAVFGWIFGLSMNGTTAPSEF